MNLKVSHALTGVVGLVAAGFIVCQLGACGGGGGGSSSDSDLNGNSDPTPMSGQYRHINLGADSSSVWTGLFRLDVNQDANELDLEVLRESDGGPPPGTTMTMDYTLDSANFLEISGGNISGEGQVSNDGTTYTAGDQTVDQSDGSGSTSFGLQLGSGRSDTLLDGPYFVATAYSPDDAGPNFFTGHLTMTFDGSGAYGTSSLTTGAADTTAFNFDGDGTYGVADSGALNIADPEEDQDILGAVRYDGEVLIGSHDLWDDGTSTWDSDTADNTRKGIFVGVQKTSNASDDLLEGTYYVRTLASEKDLNDNSNDAWDEGYFTMTLDAQGSGNFETAGGESGTVDIDLNDDGTFLLPSMNIAGAVSPEGEVIVMVNTSRNDYDEYEIDLGVKQP